MNWLNDELRREIKRIFEPRYKKTLSDSEVELIAINLTELLGGLLKLKWREKYENTIQNSK
ncbi:hypothetical protein A3F57_03225 [Candidatus Roizmanbacteria bacterium RIFCSPHIGHO2_12_FULL_36_11]|uniref:Uncharacterized protein n=1 Tax=Candidatus Curtissbacteria bacterium RIFCSPLOWO2_01_FULL_37_9 TaxID=1797724 RepID=A0A1F5GUR7_9BACT|nr:MAG: hypothetical protein A3A48_03720 [Candidatus Curtissbacteria bacterium RIFCSPLOWO2_01_FULL_37_9]OGK32574.1 MAG: hypothetical protein A3F57_03225 [Candidatus Roizmanbacteria bacterium RIFCSPHIGHO2_12_FULL_36_11]